IDSAEVADWVRRQNEATRGYLDSLAGRDSFEGRLRSLMDYERFGVPQSRAGRSVYQYNSGQLEQSQLWVSDDLPGRGRLLLDPNLWSADGTVSLGQYQLSPDGRYLAYGVSDGGSDWRTWSILDIDADALVDEPLPGIKFSGVSWLADSSGFFYSRYPKLDEDASQFDDRQQITIWFHKIGTDQSQDLKIFAVTDHATRNPYATVSDDGRYLIINLFDGYEANGIYIAPLNGQQISGSIVRLFDDWDARYDYIGNVGERFYFKTTLSAPLGRVISVSLSAPKILTPVIKEQAQAIVDVSLVDERLIVSYIIDAHAQVQIYSIEGELQGAVELPGKGTVSGFAGRIDEEQTYFGYTDFTTPLTIYRFFPASLNTQQIFTQVREVSDIRYISEQIFYTSRDGTTVPMTIVRRTDLKAGPVPTVLYGYGGFNVSLLPRYSAARMAWINAGGAYAVANLRGGGEYGQAWHLAGTRLNKQNVFDDFIAAAEWLIETEVTTPEQLAIWGGSNGGLLVGAVAQQRPDLFAAAIPAVGVLDMLRYQTASANARQWSSDYGLSENVDEFAALYAYSPLHNLKIGNCYPATLVMADANDDRVLPWHSYKYVSALQFVQQSNKRCQNPSLIRIETRTGHGGGAATSKVIEEFTDQWAFVAHATGLSEIPK
ncbi:MAG: prolyl oligopeptidase family serine peptidase, partial [Gammaproteobacteria bacterium]|nr:prolyl oligopeptidase family serine peptidase [Gammaproteobacteria bacterium]